MMDGRSMGPTAGANPCFGGTGCLARGLSPRHSCFHRANSCFNPSPVADMVLVGQDRAWRWSVGKHTRQTHLRCRGLGCPPCPQPRGTGFLRVLFRHMQSCRPQAPPARRDPRHGAPCMEEPPPTLACGGDPWGLGRPQLQVPALGGCGGLALLPEASCPVPVAPSLLPRAVNQRGRGCWCARHHPPVPPTSPRGLSPMARYLPRGSHLSPLSLSNASLWAAFCSLIMMFFSAVTWPQKPIRHRSGSIPAEPGPHGEEIGRCPARGGVCAARSPTPSRWTQVP